MTQLVARLVLAMLILPVSGAVFVILSTTLLGQGGPPGLIQVLTLWTVTYLFIGAYWVLLWRSVVRWTAARKLQTVLAVPGALVLGALVGVAFMELVANAAPFQIAVLVGGGVVPIAWVLATVLIWRETPRERMERISAAGRDAVCCPICGYNMTGLHEDRCPECGSKFTLDQLLAGQPVHERAALPEE